jgi:hypothetical protein
VPPPPQAVNRRLSPVPIQIAVFPVAFLIPKSPSPRRSGLCQPLIHWIWGRDFKILAARLPEVPLLGVKPGSEMQPLLVLNSFVCNMFHDSRNTDVTTAVQTHMNRHVWLSRTSQASSQPKSRGFGSYHGSPGVSLFSAWHPFGLSIRLKVKSTPHTSTVS